jgi:hypothetical protein
MYAYGRNYGSDMPLKSGTGALQGMGPGPTGVLAGRSDGSLCLITHRQEGQAFHCLLEAPPFPGSEMECLAATDEVVVTGSYDGAMRVVRMDTPMLGS